MGSYFQSAFYFLGDRYFLLEVEKTALPGITVSMILEERCLNISVVFLFAISNSLSWISVLRRNYDHH